MEYQADRGKRILGVIAILAGAFTVLMLLSSATLPRPSAPDQQLAVFNTNQNAYLFYGIANVLFGIFFPAFTVGFARFVRQKSPSIASAAAFLTAGSALVGTVFEVFYVDTLFSILDGPSAAAYSTDATYFAAVAANFIDHIGLTITLVGAAGLLLFGWLIWKGNLFPNWLAYVLLAGGIFGILEQLMAIGPSVASVASIFLTLFSVLLTVWALASGVSLLRTKSMTAAARSMVEQDSLPLGPMGNLVGTGQMGKGVLGWLPLVCTRL